MNNQKISVQRGEAFYVTIMFVIEGKLVMVRHHKKNEIKIPGGTYSGSINKWKEVGEEKDYFDNFSERKTQNKIYQILKKSLGGNIQKITNKGVYEQAIALGEEFSKDYVRSTGVVEMSEEIGLIPYDLELFHHQVRGIQQFFFICKNAIAYNKDREKYIFVKKISDIPERDRDFICQDSEVAETILVDLKDLANTDKYNFSYSHRKPLKNFMLKSFAESNM